MENSQSISAVAENWYARLNRLKERYVLGGFEPKKEEQIKRLIGIMIARMMRLVPQYMEAKHKMDNKFKPGGVMLKGYPGS